MSEEPIVVFASFKPRAGAQAAVEQILKSMVASTRAEPGNMGYDLYEQKHEVNEGRSFHLFEKYKDSAALEAHRGTDHYKNYRASIGEYLAEPIEVKVLQAIDARC